VLLDELLEQVRLPELLRLRRDRLPQVDLRLGPLAADADGRRRGRGRWRGGRLRRRLLARLAGAVAATAGGEERGQGRRHEPDRGRPPQQLAAAHTSLQRLVAKLQILPTVPPVFHLPTLLSAPPHPAQQLAARAARAAHRRGGSRGCRLD